MFKYEAAGGVHTWFMEHNDEIFDWFDAGP